MNTTDYLIDVFNSNMMDEIMRVIRQDCRCIAEVKVVQSLYDPRCKMTVTRRDTGIWEWNDEVISCKE